MFLLKTKMRPRRRDRAALTQPAVERIIARLEKAHPDAKLDLDFKNPLELLVALILAAQARDDLVNAITPRFFKRYRTAADYAAAAPVTLEREIGKINFYRTKARAIHNCANELVARFGGKVPDNLPDLLCLPGIGRKSANILLGNAFGQATIGVDRHVLRVSQRLGLTQHRDPDKAESDLTKAVPPPRRVRFCHLLQYHGRRICLAKVPRCPACPVRDLCPYGAAVTSSAARKSH